MANPYGIEQVDVPGLLGMHQGLKRQRIADLMAAREYEIKAKEADRQDRKDQTLARIFMKGGDQSSTGSAQTAPVTPAAPPAGYAPELPASAGQGAMLTADQAAATRQALGEERYQAWKAKNGITEEGELTPSQVDGADIEVAAPHPLDNHEMGQPLPPRTDGLTIDMDALRELYAIDPVQAGQIQKLVYDSDKQQLEKATARGEAMAVAASALRSLPEAQRQSEMQGRWGNYLAERGWPAELISRADLSDRGLETYYRQGRTLEKVISSAEGERDYRLRVDNQNADNARADRADARASRGEARADRADDRAAVRFRERDKDRAALAASGGGIRSDTSDLDY